MDNIFLELIRQIPNAAAVIVTVYLFLQDRQRAEESRVANAKELEAERRTHELQINNMWAQFLKNLSDDNAKNLKEIIEEIHRHEDASRERYDRLKITQQLHQAAQKKRIRQGS
jgi:hypothetical protein